MKPKLNYTFIKLFKIFKAGPAAVAVSFFDDLFLQIVERSCVKYSHLRN